MKTRFKITYIGLMCIGLASCSVNTPSEGNVISALTTDAENSSFSAGAVQTTVPLPQSEAETASAQNNPEYTTSQTENELYKTPTENIYYYYEKNSDENSLSLSSQSSLYIMESAIITEAIDIYFDSVQNPELFSEYGWYNGDDLIRNADNFCKVKSGDKINDYYVSEATTYFKRVGDSYEPLSQNLKLKGDAALKGILYRTGREAPFWMSEDTIFFYPYAESIIENQLPILVTNQMGGYCFLGDNFSFFTDTFLLSLGDVDSFEKETGILLEENFSEAEITASGFDLNWSETKSGEAISTAEIVSVEIISEFFSN